MYAAVQKVGSTVEQVVVKLNPSTPNLALTLLASNCTNTCLPLPMSFGAPRGRPTQPPVRAGYRRDQTRQKWANLDPAYTEWSWVTLKLDVNERFRKGDVVCLLDVQSGRISPTPREGQANSWQKKPADTEYRIAKWDTDKKKALCPCEDGRGSINHTNLSRTKGGRPSREPYEENSVVYLLPNRNNYVVRYPDPKTGTALALSPDMCGRVAARTSHSSGRGMFDQTKTTNPERTFYVVYFPVEYEEAKWVTCNIAVNTEYLGEALSAQDQELWNKSLTAALSAPRLVKLPPHEVQIMQTLR
ncbi:hypothetical protein PYCCODRAFT_1438991 [Trametes coccinea BRFM310]|uniref:Uncharacterized protein n=1 Tax=Trametes coccinea (strain BRFM310) TaxID=1353009 RepID=A0A1Y2IBY6_TRAC3|nr:hypothetical protein PYCCODRAFT_1438991 [Trametes coccinea BRFM310]